MYVMAVELQCIRTSKLSLECMFLEMAETVHQHDVDNDPVCGLCDRQVNSRTSTTWSQPADT